MVLEEIILVKRLIIVDGVNLYYKGVNLYYKGVMGLDGFLQEEMCA